MALDKEILAERISTVHRHLARVKEQLPKDIDQFTPNSNASDSVILHLWQSIQLIIDIAVSLCVQLDLGAPTTYAEAFTKLAEANVIKKDLAIRLRHASGFRNRIVHAYEQLDLKKIYFIAQEGPNDLRDFLAAVADIL